MKKYRILEAIGDGTYGTVYKGVYNDSGEFVAIKKLKSKIKSWNECVDLNEVKVLSKLKSHQNIIKLKEVIRETNSDVYLVFEYANLNLYQYIQKARSKGETLSERKIKEIIYQITSGLNYTHTNGYLHRDLKPENILMIDEYVNSNEECLKLADFGLAREIPSYYSGQMTDYVCTRWYRAPECILKSTNYSSAMDIWAIGCVMAELYLLAPIFPGNSETDQLTKVVNILGTPKFNEWPEGYKLIQKSGIKFPSSSGVHLSSLLPNASNEAINLLDETFNWDAVSRPNCAKILQNTYFDEVRPSNKQSKYPVASTLFSSPYISNSNYLTNTLNNTNVYQPSYYATNKQGESYLNNFNFNNYRSNNNIVPNLNSYNNPHPIYNNQTTKNNNTVSKLSKLAENDFKFNKYTSQLNQYNNTYKDYTTKYDYNDKDNYDKYYSTRKAGLVKEKDGNNFHYGVPNSFQFPRMII